MTEKHTDHAYPAPHVVAQKVRFDEDGNVTEYTEDVRYAGPEDIELDVGDGPINGAEFLNKLKDPEYRALISRRREAMEHPLRAFVDQGLAATSEEE